MYIVKLHEKTVYVKQPWASLSDWYERNKKPLLLLNVHFCCLFAQGIQGYSRLILHGGNGGDCRHAPSQCLRALEMLSVEIHNFLIHEGCPLPRNEMPWCPCPFKKEAYRPVYRNVFAGKTLDCKIYSVDPVLKLVEDSRDSKCLPNIFTRKQNMLSKFFFF